MNSDDIRTQLEREWSERQDEILFLQNHGTSIDQAEKQDRYHRLLILILYAHFEGFFKFAMTAYATYVNSLEIKCRDAQHALVATTLNKLFVQLKNPGSKSTYFKKDLPEDSKLRGLVRNCEFVERSQEYYENKIIIFDNIINTESNLRSGVIKRNLFLLGFEPDSFAHLDSDINKLVELRNSISHGANKKGVDSKEYEKLRDSIFSIISSIIVFISDAMREKKYLRPNA